MAALVLGESGQSPSLGAKMGPAEGTQLRSAPRKAHPVLRPNPQTGTQAAVMFLTERLGHHAHHRMPPCE